MSGATTKVPQNIDFCGGELRNFKFQNLNVTPSNLVESMCYYDTVNHKPQYHNGTTLVDFGRVYSEGTGISISAQNAISVNLSATNIPNLASNKITAMTGYSIASATSAITTSDSLNSAIGKLEYHINHLATSDIPDLSATYLLASLKGANNGVASLGSDGKVPNSQLPSFVDDVVDSYIVSGATALSSGWLSATDGGSALTPETGKIYVVLTSGTYLNKTYRWSGTTYVEISASPGNATESAAGIAEIATNSEITTGADDTRIVTPLKLATYYQRKLTFSTGLTNTSNTITVTDYDKLLKNKAGGNKSYTIGGNAAAGSCQINIGDDSKVSGRTYSGTYAVGIGDHSIADARSVALGGYAEAATTSSTTTVGSIAIGYLAKTSVTGSIQLLNGTNSIADTFQVKDYTLLNLSNGIIPDDRISSTIKNGAAAGATAVQKLAVNNTALTASGGVTTWEITHGLGTDDVCLTVKDVSTGEVIFPAWKITSGKVTIEFLASANIAADTYRAIIMG